MAVSYRGFQIELYEEYLSDGGFVAEQRARMLANPLGKWGLLQDWEERIEAYIDGLSVGAALALEVCSRRAVEGEPSEFHIATRAFARASRFDLLEKAIEEAEAADGPKADALVDGLLHERIPGISDLIVRLAGSYPALTPKLARVIGYQRLPLHSFLTASEPSDSVLWALGRIRHRSTVPLMSQALRGKSPTLRTTASLALARTQNSLDFREDWPLSLYGLMGEQGWVDELIRRPEPLSSIGLGLMGLPSVIPTLISRLPQPEAALALQLITGAGLIEDQPIPDETLEESERPATEPKLVIDTAKWQAWWQKHERDFAADVPYRSGAPYSVAALYDLLQDPDQMHVERHWAAEQLACRHGQALSFEVDMLVANHPAALAVK